MFQIECECGFNMRDNDDSIINTREHLSVGCGFEGVSYIPYVCYRCKKIDCISHNEFMKCDRCNNFSSNIKRLLFFLFNWSLSVDDKNKVSCEKCNDFRKVESNKQINNKCDKCKNNIEFIDIYYDDNKVICPKCEKNNLKFISVGVWD